MTDNKQICGNCGRDILKHFPNKYGLMCKPFGSKQKFILKADRQELKAIQEKGINNNRETREKAELQQTETAEELIKGLNIKKN